MKPTTECAPSSCADPILRITADCPFVDPPLVGRVLAKYQEGGWDHVSSATGATAFKMDGLKFPDGLDVECFGFGVFAQAHAEATVKSDREQGDAGSPGEFLYWDIRAELGWPKVIDAELTAEYGTRDLRDTQFYIAPHDVSADP